jgi:hypothetical protein
MLINTSRVSILSHKGNANQNYTKVPSHCRVAIIKKTTNAGEDLGKKKTTWHGGSCLYSQLFGKWRVGC